MLVFLEALGSLAGVPVEKKLNINVGQLHELLHRKSSYDYT